MAIDGLPVRPSKPINAHRGAVNAVRFNSSGQYCATAGTDKTVRLWNPQRPLLLKTYSGHGYEVADVCVSMDNGKLASCGGDKVVFLWDVTTAQVVRRFGGTKGGGHTARINCVAFAGADDALILSGSYDTSLRFWDVRSRNMEPVQVLDEAKDSVSSVAVRAHEVLSASIDGRARVYDIRTGHVTVDDLKHPLGATTFSGDGNCILAATLKSALALVDKASGVVLAVYKGHVNDRFKVECSLSCDDAFVMSGSEDGSVAFWDLVESENGPLAKPKAHSQPCCTVDCHPKENMALSGSHDGTMVLWKA
eukprot:Plantae.Rhodophyta-Purpureofilum_apyrenoidigerum.ctg20942.p1 GENE.Plantae.Rhodophyta-Purpureofilum_apyrenoidigerum.ctg20942~~Plantae.Rhodophyta-Purpureofilum_apyrenoidigerum.ctg20942.p1  ORF type:complete len:308 (-),score=55.96 Plantae.Rhodophyta-Purpureofilum_apyrenoidigerum.ctg20942:845-1768(-)